MNTKIVDRKGFTLIELMIAIIIIAVLSTIAVVGYSGLKQRALEAAARSDLEANRKILQAYYAQYHRYPNAVNFSSTSGCSPSSSGSTSNFSAGQGDYPCLVVSDSNLYSAYNGQASKGGVWLTNDYTYTGFRLDVSDRQYAYSIDQNGNYTKGTCQDIVVYNDPNTQYSITGFQCSSGISYVSI